MSYPQDPAEVNPSSETQPFYVVKVEVPDEAQPTYRLLNNAASANLRKRKDVVALRELNRPESPSFVLKRG